MTQTFEIIKGLLLQEVVKEVKNPFRALPNITLPVAEAFPNEQTRALQIPPQQNGVIMQEDPGKYYVAFISELYCNYYQNTSRWQLQIDNQNFEGFTYAHSIGTPDKPKAFLPPFVCQKRLAWRAFNDSIDETLCFECYMRGLKFNIAKFKELNLKVI